MARISYVEQTDGAETAPIAEKIKAGRRGEVINIYKLLLHAPALAETWYDHISATRWKTTLDARLRELVIVRIAQANNYQYALRQHVPGIAVPDGVSLEECEALKDWQPSKFFSSRERAVLAYVDAMMASADVSDAIFESLRACCNEREIVEISVLVGTYLMHHRVFTALRVDLQPERP